MIILTKFHENAVKIIDILLMVNFVKWLVFYLVFINKLSSRWHGYAQAKYLLVTQRASKL